MAGKELKKKRLLTASLVSGLLNAGYGYVLYKVAPPTTFRGGYTGGGAGFTGGGAGFAGRAAGGTELEFVISSFIVGFLFVLVIIGIALAYARYRKKPEEEPEELTEPEEPEESEAADVEKPSKKPRK